MNFFTKRLLLSLAASVISMVEAEAIAYYAEHGEDLQGKAELGKAKLRELYAQYQRRVPVLAASPLDELLVEAALAEAWERIDDRIKQAARQVKGAAPAPGDVTVTDAYVPPTRRPVEDGVTPTTAADHGADLHPTPPMAREQ